MDYVVENSYLPQIGAGTQEWDIASHSEMRRLLYMPSTSGYTPLGCFEYR
jgi:hypothetical protein